MIPLRKNKTSQNQIGKEKALIDVHQTDKEGTSEENSEIGAGMTFTLNVLCENFHEITLCYFHS